jgi:hypothetical protein
MKSPTLRNTAQKIGLIIHQSAYAGKMQAEVVRELLAQGYELGVHDELIATGAVQDPDVDKIMADIEKMRERMTTTRGAAMRDYYCPFCLTGWDIGENHKCK